MATRLCCLLLATLVSACADPYADAGQTEVISRVVLTFTPTAGGDPLVFEFDDPDGDGGVSGTADAITLPAGEDFTLELAFIDGLGDPPADITEEIAAEAEDHLVLIFGDAVIGPASNSSVALLTHAYADLESDYGPNAVGDDLPVGLANSVHTNTTGTGTLRIALRHLPELNGSAQKTADVPELARDGELLPGNVDVDVSFVLNIQ